MPSPHLSSNTQSTAPPTPRTPRPSAQTSAQTSVQTNDQISDQERSLSLALSAFITSVFVAFVTSVFAASMFCPNSSFAETPSSSLPSDYLHFTRACEAGEQLTIAGVGDVLIHRELQRQAWKQERRFGDLWVGIADLIAAADLSYANLEGPTAPGIKRNGSEAPDPGERFDNAVYTGYARFNYHPRLLKDLKDAGFDVVSTANNHALDRLQLGVDRTIDELRRAKLKFTGTRKCGESGAWHTITKSKGFKIAWIACTEHANRFKDTEDQVLFCYAEEKELLAEIKKLAKKKSIDAIIVTPHWGRQYQHVPHKKQRVLAQKVIDAGATLVLGNHPHVIQPWEKMTAKDGRESFVMYSLGNFVSHQPDLPKRSTALLYVGLTRLPSGETILNGVRYIPLHTRHEETRDFYFTEAIDRVGGWDDARRLITDLLGSSNLLSPEAPLVTNPHCDPTWTPSR